jgi:hypothetical protein
MIRKHFDYVKIEEYDKRILKIPANIIYSKQGGQACKAHTACVYVPHVHTRSVSLAGLCSCSRYPASKKIKRYFRKLCALRAKI